MLADPEMTIKEVAGVNRATAFIRSSLNTYRQRLFALGAFNCLARCASSAIQSTPPRRFSALAITSDG